MSDLYRAAQLLALSTVALVAVAVFVPGRLEIAARAYALVVSGALIVLALLSLRRAYPPETAQRARRARPGRGPRPPTLDRLEHGAALGIAGAFDLHFRLVPQLRTIATGLLVSRRKVSLEERPDAARAILGEEVWELVRPDRPAPIDRHARGLAPHQLERVVDTLEAV